jgi:ATP dependent DNA ligase-like protein
MPFHREFPRTKGRWSKRAVGGEHWITPFSVVEVTFTERTPDGHIRHPTFKGVRKDKLAKDVRGKCERSTQVPGSMAAHKSLTWHSKIPTSCSCIPTTQSLSGSGDEPLTLEALQRLIVAFTARMSPNQAGPG